ncbi:MAG: hypothetical protein LC776_10495 [Acidobacteria bacterium]|nr:hypothetical protein [Acidobacteriota bacterium]
MRNKEHKSLRIAIIAFKSASGESGLLQRVKDVRNHSLDPAAQVGLGRFLKLRLRH